jgi:hypothetical protein
MGIDNRGSSASGTTTRMAVMISQTMRFVRRKRQSPGLRPVEEDESRRVGGGPAIARVFHKTGPPAERPTILAER